MLTKDIISNQAQTIARLQQECTEKTKMIEDISTALSFTSRQYEVLQKKYAEVLRIGKQKTDSYECCLTNLKEEIGRLKNAR